MRKPPELYFNDPATQEVTNTIVALATRLHSGQTRKHTGEPYIHHPLRVAYAVKMKCGSVARTWAAVIHDVIEDCDIDLFMTEWSALRSLYPEFAVLMARALRTAQILTKHPGESYAQFIERVAEDPDATMIKLEDISDNLCDAPSPKQIAKYTAAIARIGELTAKCHAHAPLDQ